MRRLASLSARSRIGGVDLFEARHVAVGHDRVQSARVLGNL